MSVEYVVSIVNTSAKKLLICLSTHVIKRHTSFRVPKLPTSAEERVKSPTLSPAVLKPDHAGAAYRIFAWTVAWYIDVIQ